ncbi:Gfo/Idh/MocA family oxidoreductase [Rhizobium leguminosarum]|nr:Gfo/Idh/MocA family oxidoreductase [Rhizobium leguminosarum]
MKRIQLGMIGGGQGSSIGGVHRIASRIDGLFDVVAGVFSSDSECNKASGLEIGVDADRVFDTVEAMIAAESLRSDAIEAVVVATPNHLQFAAAKACLGAGLHVICDKPVTSSLADSYLSGRAVREEFRPPKQFQR